MFQFIYNFKPFCDPFRCMHFYYYLSGLSGGAQLSAYVRETDDGSGVSIDMHKTLFFQQKTSQGDMWIKAEGRITMSRNFQVGYGHLFVFTLALVYIYFISRFVLLIATDIILGNCSALCPGKFWYFV